MATINHKNQKKIPKINPKYVIIASFLAGALLLVYFLAMPMFAKIQSLVVQIDDVKAAKEAGEKLLSKFDDFSRQYQHYETEIKKLAYTPTSQNEISGIIYEIDTMSVQNGLLLKTMGLSDPKKAVAAAAPSADQESGAPPVQPQLEIASRDIDLEVFGSYEAFRNFINTIEKNPRIIDVLSISLKEFKEGTNLMGINLQARIYVSNQ